MLTKKQQILIKKIISLKFYNTMERLKGKKQIDQLFMAGASVGAFPLRMVYLKGVDKHLVGVSVSKKHFKRAVDRNRIKRLLRVTVDKQLSVVLEKLDSKFCF